jgi:mono/diheme cytochrome c family protein
VTRSITALALLVWIPAAGHAAGPDGAALWHKHCQSCHGRDGRGNTAAGKALKVESLVDPKWAAPESLSQIEKAVREGVPRMPAMAKKMTPEEITAAAKHTQELAKQAAP